jgi:hypothetical protein
VSRTRHRDYPVGIPIQPPPGWRAPPPEGVSPWRVVGVSGLLSLMVLSCMMVGWLSVQGAPRRPKKKAPPVVTDTKGKPADPEPMPEEAPEPTPMPPAEKKVEGKTPSVARSYQKDVLPILERNCTSCHGGKNRRGGVDVSTYALVSKVVKPGNPADSTLLESIVSGNMPPKKPTAVSEAERQLIREWIIQGAKP